MRNINKERRNNSEGESEIESKIVTVGSNQGHRALMIIILALLIGGVYYLYFSPSHKEISEVIKKEETRQNVQELKGGLEQVPDNMLVPEMIITDPLPSLPPLPIPPIIPEIKQIRKDEQKPKEVHVTNIPILPKENFPSGNNITGNLPTSFPVISSEGYPRDRRSTQMLTISGYSGENKTSNAILADTLAQSSKATRVWNLGLMIAQGKIIDAILETAINSDLQGMLRAIVSKDVYAETGNIVLIPKGSRLIGSYTFDSNVARARLNINWNRVILPHGIDIAISSLSTDELGRAGIAGIVDNKIISALFSSIALAGFSISSVVAGQKFSNLITTLAPMDAVRSMNVTEIDFSLFKDIIGEIGNGKSSDKWKLDLKAIGEIRNAKDEQDLLKIIKIEIAKVLETKEGNVPISLENVNQLLQQFQRKNKSIYDEEIGKSINNFSKDMQDIIGRYSDKKLTIYVDQGTALKVFVNKDIVFPSHAAIY